MRTALLACALLSSFLGARRCHAAPPEPVFAGKPLAHWVGLLKDDNPLVREEAVAVLGEMGAPAQDALPALRPLLKSTDARLRLRAVTAVWKIGRDGKEIMPVLLDALRDDKRDGRTVALNLLSQMGTSALPSAPTVVALLDDDDTQTRARASNVLRQLGLDAIPAVVKGMKDGGPLGRYQCVQFLLQYSMTNPQVTEALAERLKDEDKKVRLEAARALLLSVPHRKAVVATLAEAAKDPDVVHRRWAVASVFMVAPRPRELLEVFAGLLDDPDPHVAGNAAQAVWEVTKDAKRVVPTLNRILKEGDIGSHITALNALRQMGPAALPCLPALLNGPEITMQTASDIVRRIGADAIPDLLAAADVRMPGAVRRNAIASLGHAGPEALPHLLRLMNAKEPEIRTAAVRSIGAIGPKAKEALPELRNIAREENPNLRAAAVTTLGSLGREGKPAVPVLLESLKDKEVMVRIAAIHALPQLPVDRSAVPALDEAIKENKGIQFTAPLVNLRLRLDPDPTPILPLVKEVLNEPNAHQQIVMTLGQAGPKARAALPLLIELAGSDRTPLYSRQSLVTALAQVDPEGKETAPALIKLLRDRDRTVRLAALGHLAQTGQECDVGPVLADLRTTDPNPRLTIHRALRLLGPKAKGATPTLLELTRGPEGPARLEAAETLCKVAPDQADLGKKVLLDALGEGEKARFDVARSLLAVDPDNARAPKVFEDGLKDDDVQRRFGALSVLAHADSSAKAVWPRIEPFLKDKNPIFRAFAARASWKMTGETEPALAVLQAILKDKEAMNWHITAVSFLGDMGPAAKPAVPALTAVLKERPPRLRNEVIMALFKIDPEAAKTAQAEAP
jgi:HEAT repeat protein